MKTLSGKRKEIYKRVINLSRGLYKNNFKEIFSNKKDRIEISLNDTIDFTVGDSYKLINNYLRQNGYVLYDYIKGYALKDGLKNKLKIGKIIKHNKYLSSNFRDCVYRQNIKLVISRHPYDIACASWGQEWDSCLNIETGVNKLDMRNMIMNNSCMIAYTVSVNNNKPLGRCLIVPYYNYDFGYSVLYPACSPYGLFPKECRDFLEKWLDDNYNYKFIFPKLMKEQKTLKFNFPYQNVYYNSDQNELEF